MCIIKVVCERRNGTGNDLYTGEKIIGIIELVDTNLNFFPSILFMRGQDK